MNFLRHIKIIFSRTISSNIVEENNQKYIYLKLANNPEGFSSNELKFHVEEEFFVENKDTKITVPASTYDYDPAIGSYGGYKINVK